MKDRFYISCFRDNFGENVVFHCKNGMGYTTDISRAELVDRHAAQKAWDCGREFDKPISAVHVDNLAVYKVDMQVIPNKTKIDDSSEYVAFERGRYCGNDVYWDTGSGSSLDFGKAMTFSRENAKRGKGSLVFIPLYIAMEKRRKTFQIRNFDARTMIQGAGIRQPEHVNRANRRSKSKEMVRWNCPKCGKINWQYNQCDFDGCSDICCDEWANI